jgi:ATP-dependent helicase HrpB
MSATLDTQAAAVLLGGAPIVTGEGRGFPVEIRYAERAPVDPVLAVESAVLGALQDQVGDLLVFLPGAGEIERVRRRLDARMGGAVEVLPLHGALAVEEQQRALVQTPGGRRRVVLATDIAETSVTIEGVTTVIDLGLARKPRFDPGSGLTRLVTEPIPLASAEQRAGRAGRLGPGLCLRLWTRAQEVGRPAHRRPEILEADLAPLVLELALWGVRDPATLRWLDPPPEHHWGQALALLQDLGALDSGGALTPLGRTLAEQPLHPRLAVLVAAGLEQGAGGLAADLAALLSERDGWIGAPGSRDPRTWGCGSRRWSPSGRGDQTRGWNVVGSRRPTA